MAAEAMAGSSRSPATSNAHIVTQRPAKSLRRTSTACERIRRSALIGDLDCSLRISCLAASRSK